MSLQVNRRSEELCISKAACLPYECNARKTAQRRSDVKDMSESAWGREQPQRIGESFYIVQVTDYWTNIEGLLTSSYFMMLKLHRSVCPREANTGAFGPLGSPIQDR